MNSELAGNDIRQAIDEAVKRYYNSPIKMGATHIDKFVTTTNMINGGTYYRRLTICGVSV